LISKTDHGRMEVLTLDDDGKEILPVFSHEEEAEMFLRFGDLACCWRVRESSAGEVVSVLYGPCAGVREVALDPLPKDGGREDRGARLAPSETLHRAHHGRKTSQSP